METVLFSCVGTSDPARGEHDAGMLHIMRHYRPAAVMIFMTAELVELDKRDNRFNRTIEFVRAHWEGYQPELLREETEIRKAHDLDVLDRPLHDAMRKLIERYPDAEILVNLSSGTPQMQIILAQMVLNLNHRMRGIQITNFERRAGTSERTNSKNYDIELELEFAEEEETAPDAENRCIEPELFPMRRAIQHQQIAKLLNRKDYRAVAEMLGNQRIVQKEALQMAEHLAARYDLQSKEAHRASAGLKLDFPLYPKKPGSSGGGDYAEVSEYFLMMKCFQQAGRYTDFVLRLDPFTIRLQEALLNGLLLRQFRIPLKRLKGTGYPARREQLLQERLQKEIPQLLAQLDSTLPTGFRDRDPSIHIYNLLLACFSELTPHEAFCRELFTTTEKLKNSRNQAAHRLIALTDGDISREAGCSCGELVKKLEQALIYLYPECDPALFRVYQRCEDYILERL